MQVRVAFLVFWLFDERIFLLEEDYGFDPIGPFIQFPFGDGKGRASITGLFIGGATIAVILGLLLQNDNSHWVS